MRSQGLSCLQAAEGCSGHSKSWGPAVGGVDREKGVGAAAAALAWLVYRKPCGGRAGRLYGPGWLSVCGCKATPPISTSSLQAAQSHGFLLLNIRCCTAGDTLFPVPDRGWVSFMLSFPNLVPLPAEQVARIGHRLEQYTFDRLYGPFPGSTIQQGAAEVVQRSMARYCGVLSGNLERRYY